MSRKCQVCGAQLSSYNPGVLCFPCQEKRKKELQGKLSDTPYYTLEDLCFLLGLRNPESVKRLARKGKIPGRVPTIRRHLYLKEQVDKWIQNSGRPPNERRERHFQELSVTALMLASNFESYLDNFGTGSDSTVGDVVYGGWLDDIHDALSVEMREVDRPLSLNLLDHLKEEFPELANISDWTQLTGDKISYDFIARLKLKANRGDFVGNCHLYPSD